MAIKKMADLDLKGKRVLIRADLNVPIKDGKVASDKRIMATLPTIKLALEKGAKVMVISHLGRPEEGVYSDEFSLQPVADYMATKLPCPVRLVKDYLDGVEVNENEVVVLENCRFNKGEKKNNEELSRKYAALCDVLHFRFTYSCELAGSSRRRRPDPQASNSMTTSTNARPGKNASHHMPAER